MSEFPKLTNSLIFKKTYTFHPLMKNMNILKISMM